MAQGAAAKVRPGDVLDGKYRIVREIGGGGMGVVFEAEHVDLGRCAIKLVLPEGLRSPDAYERFRREAKAARALASKHAVKVYDFGRGPAGVPYLVMELLDGEDLQVLFEERGRLPAGEVIGYLVQACDALAEAHDAGIVHRDLKPGNLFLTRDKKGRPLVKVLDFGIAKMAPLAGGNEEMTGELRLGTLAYMPPEQLRKSREVDARADVWSLGVVLYRLVTGEMPFDGESIWEIGDRILKQEPVLPSALAPVPAGFDAVVMRCLAKEPAGRYASMEELSAALSGLSGLSATGVEVGESRASAGGAAAPSEAVLKNLPALGGDESTSEMATLPDAPIRRAPVTATLPGAPLPLSARVHTAPAWATTGGGAPSRPLRAWVAVGVAVLSLAGLVTGGLLFAGRGGSGGGGVSEGGGETGTLGEDVPGATGVAGDATGSAGSAAGVVGSAAGVVGSAAGVVGSAASVAVGSEAAGEPLSASASASASASGGPAASVAGSASAVATAPASGKAGAWPAAKGTQKPASSDNDPLGLGKRRKIGQ